MVDTNPAALIDTAWSIRELVDEYDLTDEEVDRRIVTRLAHRGPECLSQLAIDIFASNRRVNEALIRLEARGIVEVRAHRGRPCAYTDDEKRWGLKLSLPFRRRGRQP